MTTTQKAVLALLECCIVDVSLYNVTKKERIKTMAKKIANRDARHYVAGCKEFKGNNLFGEMRGQLYVVYSYGYHWPLFVCSACGVWYENASKYSVSTSKHKSQSNPLVTTIPMSVEDLKTFIADNS